MFQNTASQSMNPAQKKTMTKIDRIEAWKQAHAAEFAWMEKATKDNEAKNGNFMFPENMLHALNTYGGLTDGQLAAVQKLTKRDAEYQAKKAAGGLEGKPCDATKIETAFAKAAEYAYRHGQKGIWKHPLKLRSNDSVDLSFKPGSKGSQWEGMIFVKAGEKKLGHIKAGQFKPKFECTDAETAAVIDVCQDPHKAANAFCKAWSTCGVCGRTLTNDNSIEKGIGPICEEKRAIKPRGVIHMKMTYMSWDRPDAIDVADINSALGEVFDGKNCPHIVSVESDWISLVFCSEKPANDKDAQIYFDVQMAMINEAPRDLDNPDR